MMYEVLCLERHGNAWRFEKFGTLDPKDPPGPLQMVDVNDRKELLSAIVDMSAYAGLDNPVVVVVSNRGYDLNPTIVIAEKQDVRICPLTRGFHKLYSFDDEDGECGLSTVVDPKAIETTALVEGNGFTWLIYI